MRLVIINRTGSHKEEVVEHPAFIPRVGERIVTLYHPWPTVRNVTYNYAAMEVVVGVD